MTKILQIESAKRTKKERVGLHAWHPYYAGYSEKFVLSTIEYLKLSQDDLVLDPWSGSGTTNYVCELRNISSIGLDINPVMSYFGQAKSGFILSLLKQYKVELQVKIIQNSQKIQQDFEYNLLLHNFVLPCLAKNLISVVKAINSCNYPTYNFGVLDRLFIENRSRPNPLLAFFLCALFITARKLSSYKSGSNPTWFKKIESKQSYTLKEVQQSFLIICDRMYETLLNSSISPNSQLLHTNYNADAKQIPFKNEQFDAIITSPPYLTRIDYAMSTQLEILLLKDEQYLRELRINTMGAPVIRNNLIAAKSYWGQTCNDVLNKIANHSSKASKTYYWKNIVQYFDDAWQILNEIYRVLKTDKSALIVIQSSYYKDIEIPLNQIYIEMAVNIGFSQIREPLKEVVKTHMAHVNTQSSAYKKNKVYYESCIELIK